MEFRRFKTAVIISWVTVEIISKNINRNGDLGFKYSNAQIHKRE
jgi:hypothetical protein